jgi:hypothetical protein
VIPGDAPPPSTPHSPIKLHLLGCSQAAECFASVDARAARSLRLATAAAAALLLRRVPRAAARRRAGAPLVRLRRRGRWPGLKERAWRQRHFRRPRSTLLLRFQEEENECLDRGNITQSKGLVSRCPKQVPVIGRKNLIPSRQNTEYYHHRAAYIQSLRGFPSTHTHAKPFYA